MSATDHINAASNKIINIFKLASDRIEALKPGEKVPATKLAEDLAKEVGGDMTGPKLYHTLKFLFDDYPGVVVKRGAVGGIYRPLPTESLEELRAKAKAKKDKE